MLIRSLLRLFLTEAFTFPVNASQQIIHGRTESGQELMHVLGGGFHELPLGRSLFPHTLHKCFKKLLQSLFCAVGTLSGNFPGRSCQFLDKGQKSTPECRGESSLQFFCHLDAQVLQILTDIPGGSTQMLLEAVPDSLGKFLQCFRRLPGMVSLINKNMGDRQRREDFGEFFLKLVKMTAEAFCRVFFTQGQYETQRDAPDRGLEGNGGPLGHTTNLALQILHVAIKMKSAQTKQQAHKGTQYAKACQNRSTRREESVLQERRRPQGFHGTFHILGGIQFAIYIQQYRTESGSFPGNTFKFI